MACCVTCKQELPRAKCAAHPSENAESCPYCDKCAHGKCRTEPCAECCPPLGNDVLRAPLTLDELKRLKEHADSTFHLHPQRYLPMRARDFRGYDVSLLSLLIREYERLTARGDQ